MEASPAGGVNDYLRFALRAYTRETRKRHRKPVATATTWEPPRRLLVFDTETDAGPGQGLLFGSARGYGYMDGAFEPLGEFLIYDDDLESWNASGFATLKEYGYQHDLPLLSRREFCEQALWRLGFKARTWIVGFNLPFDLSRVAIAHGDATKRYYGGFSLTLWGETASDGTVRENRYRPRVLVNRSTRNERSSASRGRPSSIGSTRSLTTPRACPTRSTASRARSSTCGR
jgi:hypothetical protein